MFTFLKKFLFKSISKQGWKHWAETEVKQSQIILLHNRHKRRLRVRVQGIQGGANQVQVESRTMKQDDKSGLVGPCYYKKHNSAEIGECIFSIMEEFFMFLLAFMTSAGDAEVF